MAKTARKDAKHNDTKMVFAVSSGGHFAGSGVTDDNGVPRRRYVKDLIRVGSWVKASTDQRFSVTPAMLSRWVDTFKAMKAAGVKVPIPATHTNDPEANRGYLEDLFVENGTLFGTLELIGEDAIALASRAEVSIYVPESITDGKGVTYQQPIAHVALVTDPVINGQGRFVPIAASRGGTVENVPVFRLAQENSSMEFLKKIAMALGIEVADGMDEAALTEAISTKIAAMKSEAEMSAKSKAEADKALAASRGEADALRKGAMPTVNPEILDLKSQNVELRLSQLIKDGKVTPAVADALKPVLIGSADARPAVSLSRESAKAAGLTEPLADTVLSALEKAPASKIGEKTGSQTVTLNRGSENQAKDQDGLELARAAGYGLKTAKAG